MSFILIMDKLNKRCSALCAGCGAVAVSPTLSVALCAGYGAVAVSPTLSVALCAGYGAVAVSCTLSVALCAGYGAVAVSPTLSVALCAGSVFTHQAVSLEHVLPLEAGDLRGVPATGAGHELLRSQQPARDAGQWSRQQPVRPGRCCCAPRVRVSRRCQGLVTPASRLLLVKKK